MKPTKEAFTLVEVMIVVMIIGLLASVALPSFMEAREASQTNACINNLRQIEGAKSQLAIRDGLGTGDTAQSGLVNSLLDGDLDCPANGSYSYGVIGTVATCDEVSGNHVLTGYS